ncbi:arabinogalactan endo-1,4-beta-galactosidase [Solwaraspora sp. WMMD792]|uniref:glycoside hydrolase family 53 protein n=1 Tax=Solwaraspora sp. WMMD792 TaxID=3016099 RepID=UPI0024175192|nr:arabinogalactan endo-1,4-beta-galactosidase [Solwaraspora sp. WMMD792]MDG4769775.1 arabinogalactan endo-1,4-beta-galactosidase [Solwaraspora sp. WMMD792]
MRIRRTLAAAAALATAIVIITPGASTAGRPAPALVNAGFEDTTDLAAPVGWTETGDRDASYVEPGGRTGDQRLSHWSAAAYRVQTRQQLTGLARGTYTLRAAVRSSGGQRSAYLELAGCGRGPAQRADLPRTGDEWWAELALSVRVGSGRCTISVVSDAAAGQWANVDDVSFTRTDGSEGLPVAIGGADVSHLTKNEASGAVYRDARGRPGDALRILADNGVNYARLKVWVDPADGFSDKADVLAKAKRARAQGMRLLIGFHYSDTWADPGKQFKPAAWEGLAFDELRQAVYDHTYDVVAALHRQGTPPAMVQVGNEINGGMLWPDGRWDNWPGLAQLLTAGSTAVTDASPRTKVALHLAEGGNNGGHRWWFDNAVAYGVPFDVIAVSHYTYWHGPLGYLQANLFDLTARYNRPVMVVETAYGFTLDEHDHETNIFTADLASAGGYPATPQGQAEALRDITNVVAAVPGGRGLGVFYWEPTWTAVDGAGWDPADPTSGDGWENQALFDYSGTALPGLRVFADVVARDKGGNR